MVTPPPRCTAKRAVSGLDPGGQLVSMPRNARDSRVCSKGTSLKLTDSIASYATLVALQVKPRR
jgi:hypothetical protein